eukprot:TRINITY_DN106123_c0_g1_i1.p1 TRINITY_DN106123_c0_g1~~TRINITY_DN106123_c0_g1_i1.p1  ORF type:complete len:662 (+),score=120.37 TRINITY_DN106123_c0_g1_i1:100-1986(+)
MTKDGDDAPAWSCNAQQSEDSPGKDLRKTLFLHAPPGFDQHEMVLGTQVDRAEYAKWSELRKSVHVFLNDSRVEVIMGLIISFNVVVMVIEVDATAGCPTLDDQCAPDWTRIANPLLLAIYTVEAALHLFQDRLRFYRSPWNLLDIAIVTFGYAELVLAQVFTAEDAKSLSYIRLLRLGRILRAVRLFKPIPELYKLVQGFLSTMRAIFWGFVMILALLAMFSILTMQVVQDYRDFSKLDDWCTKAFSTTLRTILFFFQTLVAGDSWGACVVPMVLESWPLFWVFASALITVQLGFTNLILSVIVDAAASTRDQDIKQKMLEQRQKEQDDLERLYDKMESIDVDGSGTLSLEELLNGYESDPECKERLNNLGMDMTELEFLFKEMDWNDSNSLSYADIVETIVKAETQDSRMQFMFLRQQLNKMSHVLNRRLAKVESSIQIVVNELSPSPRSHEQKEPKDVECRSGSGVGAKLSQEEASGLPKVEVKLEAAKDKVASGVAGQLEQELRSMGVDLQGRLEALVRDAEVHVAALVRHGRELSTRLSEEVPKIHQSPSPPSIAAAPASTPATASTPAPASMTGEQRPGESNLPERSPDAGISEFIGGAPTTGAQSFARRIGRSDDRVKYRM